MRILGLTVGRNEADRYLVPMLKHHLAIFDAHLFYDDRSNDETAELARHFGCVTVERPEDRPSFLDNEGRFREDAYRELERHLAPELGDWVFSVDCDETLVTDKSAAPLAVRAALHQAATTAGLGGCLSVDLTVVEVWGFNDTGRPLVRSDGQWGGIHGTRLFAWRAGGFFEHQAMGAPAQPTYVRQAPTFSTLRLKLLHYGYADPADHLIKYNRYSGRGGHSNAHVSSILDEHPHLESYFGPYLSCMRKAHERR